jgi:hypothetical protein
MLGFEASTVVIKFFSRVVQIAGISAIASAAGAAITIVAIQNATERQSQVALQQGRLAYGQIKAKQVHCTKDVGIPQASKQICAPWNFRRMAV